MASVARVGSRRDPTIASVSRYTTAGRKLTYELRVIQQPERARACGSGAKSSADRRPVDPPPVVELRIFEGEGVGEDREDITFGYGANFFLYATLEVARPMAQIRGQQSAGPVIPVLTGMPVSGMAYLDRPSEAGYFIFPDLSVRHEGIYSLSFNLYEETKDQSDRDAEPSDGTATGPAAADPSFDWRLEVKSDAFTVYSAKKFPGLAESTALSRTVAEQGCRVRIRRDVRMRRRDNKGSAEVVGSPEDEWSRPGRPMEKDTYRDQPRSHASDDGRAPAPPGGYRPGSDSPLLAPAPRPEGGATSFRSGNAAAQPLAPMARYSAPPPPPPFPPAPAAYPPPVQPPYEPPPRYNPPPPPLPLVHPGYSRPHPVSAFSAEPSRERDMYDAPPPVRRASEAYPAHPYPLGAPYPAGDPPFPRPAYGPPSPIPRLPPLKSIPKHDLGLSPPGPLSARSQYSPPLATPTVEPRPVAYSQYPPPPPLAPAPLSVAPPPASPRRVGEKRPYDAVFNASPTTQPLHNGMRPSSPDFDADEDNEEEFAAKMEYKRADGSQNNRFLNIMR
ncbi:unnamed protein product [Diplocarpon coronariae]